MKNRGGWIIAIAFFMLTAGDLFAEEAAKSPVLISGFVDIYYSYNFNTPVNMNNELRNFDLKSDQFSLNMAEIVFSKTPSADAPTGFRIDLDFGPTTDLVHTPATGVPVADQETFKHIQQAYVSLMSGPATIDFGKFVTHLGAEVIETKDNMNYSRGLLFAWAIPYYHTGVRVSVPLSEALFINGYVYNGTNVVTDNNDAFTYGTAIGITPFKGLSLIQNWIGGPERSVNTSDSKHTLDTVATLNLTDQLTLAANYDYGWEDFPAGKKSWKGIAGYLRYAATDRSAAVVRYEWFDDVDGNQTGTAQELQEVTLTGEYKLAGNLLTRIEYRRDWSDRNIFDKDAGVDNTDSQATALIGMVYIF